jgi:amphi-Trp domain-containing protein
MSDGEHQHERGDGDETVRETDATPESETGDDAPTTIRPGREFEREYRLSAAQAGEFLVAVGERLRDGEELTVTDPDGEWTLPFTFGEPVELEVDYEGVGDAELELEVELPGRPDDCAPDVS